MAASRKIPWKALLLPIIFVLMMIYLLFGADRIDYLMHGTGSFNPYNSYIFLTDIPEFSAVVDFGDESRQKVYDVDGLQIFASAVKYNPGTLDMYSVDTTMSYKSVRYVKHNNNSVTIDNINIFFSSLKS